MDKREKMAGYLRSFFILVFGIKTNFLYPSLSQPSVAVQAACHRVILLFHPNPAKGWFQGNGITSTPSTTSILHTGALRPADVHLLPACSSKEDAWRCSRCGFWHWTQGRPSREGDSLLPWAGQRQKGAIFAFGRLLHLIWMFSAAC